MTARTWEYPATILDWHDGDTVRCDLDQGLDNHAIRSVRVAGVDCPELDTDAGRAALAFVEGLLPAGSRVLVTSLKREKFGRVLGRITLAGGSDLSTLLLDAGHARPYDGGKRT